MYLTVCLLFQLFVYIFCCLFTFRQLFVYVFSCLFTLSQLFVYVFNCLFTLSLFTFILYKWIDHVWTWWKLGCRASAWRIRFSKYFFCSDLQISATRMFLFSKCNIAVASFVVRKCIYINRECRIPAESLKSHNLESNMIIALFLSSKIY